ncbi:putative ribonuclease H-like domain-containing protein [Tanacetum coccineum]
MNYEPVVAGNQSNGIAGTNACENAGKARVETVPLKNYILLPFLTQDLPFSSSSKDSLDAGFKPLGDEEKKDVEHLENEDSEVPNIEEPRVNQEQDESVNSTNNINTVSSTINTASIEDNTVDENTIYGCTDDPNMPNLEEIVYSEDDEGVGAEADMNNLDTFMLVTPIPTTRIHKDHLFEQIIGDLHSAPQTRRMTKSVTEHEPKKVWTLVDLPYGKRAIGTKWVYKNKKDERGIVIRNKARIEAIRLFLAYASFKDFVVYQMDVKSAFLYGKIEEEVYVCEPPGFEDPEFPDRVYKRGTIDKTLFIKKIKGDILLVQVYVDDIIFGSTKKSLCTEFEKLMHKKFQMSSIGELTFFLGLQVTQKNDRIFISQDKYVDEILKKFGFSTVKTTSTHMETSKPLMKDENAEDVDVHLYRSMIGSLMYLTSSRPDIMFVVCACARFQVTPKVSHLHAVKRIFRYLKGQPKLGLWYPKDSPFDLEAYTDSDYAGASLDRKSTTGGCQFLGSRLISWQCKKQTVVANSTTEAEYVAASNCCGQVLWIQNQLLDYGYNFMNTKIFIDNESTICIVKNLVFHSKTKHIEIRHHFIRDSYEKRLIQVIKIHTDHNVADLLTKAFDVSRFQYLIAKHADFDEIVDFLNASPIRYALTISPTIYVSYIEQFWSTAKIKIVNNERQIRAKVDGKTIVDKCTDISKIIRKQSKTGKHGHENQKSTKTLTVNPTIYTSCIKQFWATTKQKTVNFGSADTTLVDGKKCSWINIEPIPIIASSSHPKKTHKRRKTKRKAIEISQSSRPTTLVADETVHDERGDSMERSATTVASLDAKQDSGNIIKTQSIATLNEPIPQGTGSGSGPRRQDTILGDSPAQTRVLALENIKTAQDLEIINLKKRVKSDQEDASKQGRDIAESDQDKEISFVQKDVETQGRYDHDIDVTTASTPITTAGVSVSTAEQSTPPTTTILIEDEDLTIAQTLMKMKSKKSKEKLKEKSKEKGVSSETALRPTRGVTIQEPKKPSNKKDQIKFDEEMAKRLTEELEAELEEEEKLAKQRE